MSVAASTEAAGWLSPLARRAAAGHLPEWARVTPQRREHIQRVVALLDEWSGTLGLDESERERWRAIGWLHDVLRSEDAAVLRAQVPEEFRDLPAPVLHGPAAAERLTGEMDERALAAIRYHSLGHPSFDEAGRALYLADYLEPGRKHLAQYCRDLRARMPAERQGVLIEVHATRMRWLLECREPLRQESVDFWNSLTGGSE